MAASPRAPKQWQLTKIETITSYESWRQNLIYLLSLDKNFVPFLDANWQKQTATNPRRGLTNGGTTVPEAQRLTAVQKNAHLNLLLGQIANFCPVISRNSIVKHSTSLNDIWQKIRQHYGFQSSGAHFLDLASIRFQPDERPEDLFQRLMAFFEDNCSRRLNTPWRCCNFWWRSPPHPREHNRSYLAPVDTPWITPTCETKVWLWITQ